jgi:hypothetical protein
MFFVGSQCLSAVAKLLQWLRTCCYRSANVPRKKDSLPLVIIKGRSKGKVSAHGMLERICWGKPTLQRKELGFY